MGRARFAINYFGRFPSTAEARDRLDYNTTSSVLKAAPTVVCLKSYSGDKELFTCSGFIMECDNICGDFFGYILTSSVLLRCSSGASMVPDDLKVGVYLEGGTFYEGEVVAFDFHYNVALIKINSDASLPTSTIRFVDDSASLNLHSCHEDSLSPALGHHDSTSPSRFRLYPGEEVFALGRYFEDAYDIMFALGEYSIGGGCKFDCKELRNASCKISKNGIGGPLINRLGEVIGINFYDAFYTPFLPINLAFKCFVDLKRYGQVPHPWIGVALTDLYAERFVELEKLYKKFPFVVRGASVQKVQSKSPAFVAGLLAGDVILNFDGNLIGSCLELAEALWDKEGESIELVVYRASSDEPLNLVIEAVETIPNEYKWPVPDRSFWYGPPIQYQSHVW